MRLLEPVTTRAWILYELRTAECASSLMMLPQLYCAFPSSAIVDVILLTGHGPR